MPSEKEGQWYNNKALFEMIQELKKNVIELSSELKTTRDIIMKYNGLRKEIDKCSAKIEAMENQAKGKKIFGADIREWTGWLVAMVLFVLTLVKG